MDDVVLARADYSRLDDAKNPIRIRLNSTVVQVRHNGSPDSAKDVAVAYMRGGKVQTVQASALCSGLLQHDDSLSLPGTAARSNRTRFIPW